MSSHQSVRAASSLLPLAAANSPWQLCVAPMIDVTDRHCRFFHRQLAPHARLYTEM
ncbi:MAG TPA: tRNA-dihydrouridine synthase, partial [Burkholderiaceae bacterium]|nr:tRNA-dihydrouridine synthase [Burkholderiaceae bacterium]